MKNILIGIVGEDSDVKKVLYKGFDEFFPDEIILLVKQNYEKSANKITKEFEKNSIKTTQYFLSSNPHMEEIFLEVKKITQMYEKDSIVINVDTDYYTSCLALSAAFVNGITAIGILKDELIVYPIMRFSYYNALNEKKQELLKIINDKENITSMEELAKIANMSLPLIAYHLRGNKDSQGLIEMNLVQTKKQKGSIEIKLTSLGRLMVAGINSNLSN